VAQNAVTARAACDYTGGMKREVITRLAGVGRDDWNRVAGTGNPFLRHEFLAALEASGCTGGDSGWQARHLLLRDDAGALLGAVPLYLKSHSYGEYVFDWAWADAYARAGLRYYPKLVAAVPFTPVTGPRLLIAPQVERDPVASALIDGALELAEASASSSLHWLFTPPAECALLESRGLLRRVGYQFHWQNRGYRDFDDYLAGFAAAKRKKIRRERRQVREAGITLEVVRGAEAGAAHWNAFHAFYRDTVRKHGAIPYLNREFFHELGRQLPEAVVLILARHGDEWVAGALNLQGADTLYGRYWGGREGYHSLHFETCYYRAIEYCIDTGLARCEAGAQGEHKLARGFLPVPTYSAHWLRHPQFAHAVSDYLARERQGLELYLAELDGHSPFKQS